MPLWDVVTPYLAPLGIAVLTLTMILRLRGQYRREATRRAERSIASSDSAGTRRGVPQQPSRLMRQEVPFSGADTTANPIRHELEIDVLGRQIIGQINSKMVVLQTLTLEAERAAHRIEILLERLEQLATTPTTPVTTTAPAISFDTAFLQDYGFSPDEIRSRLSRKTAS